jgi:hypothetical protein
MDTCRDAIDEIWGGTRRQGSGSQGERQDESEEEEADGEMHIKKNDKTGGQTEKGITVAGVMRKRKHEEMSSGWTERHTADPLETNEA